MFTSTLASSIEIPLFAFGLDAFTPRIKRASFLALIESVGKRFIICCSSAKINKKGKDYFSSHFKKLKIQHILSVTNFITTIWDSKEQAALITQKLLIEGIIVRHLSSFGWPNCIRISIGLEKENQKFIKCLQRIL